MNQKTIIWLLSTALILSVAWYFIDTKFIPFTFNQGVADGQRSVILSQVERSEIFWIDSNGTVINYPIGQFCNAVLNQGGSG